MRHSYLLLIGLSAALLAGCNNDDSENANAGGEASVTAEASASASESVTPEPSPSASPSPTLAEPSPSSSPEDPLRRYVEAIPGDSAGDAVVFSAEADLDLDGQAETVLALGERGDEFNDIRAYYVLRDVGGEVMRIGDNLAPGDGYMTSDAKLVTLQGDPRPYLYAGLTNGAALNGFRLFALDGGQPAETVYSASAAGAGDDYLVDGDGDGRYDGYVQHRYSYDTLYYDVQRSFSWNAEKGAFAQTETSVALEEPYPVDIEEVVYQFLSLGAIDDGHSSGLTKRLSELSAISERDRQSIDWELWRIALFDAAMEIPGSYSIEVEEKGKQATAVVAGKTETKSGSVTFRLAKKQDRWSIASIG